MPRKSLRRAASKEALKQMQLLSATAFAEEENDSEAYEIPSDEDEEADFEMPPKKKYRLSHRKSSDGNDRDVIVLKSVAPSEDALQLETWIEEASPAQLAYTNKIEKEWQELQAKLNKITKQNGAEVIYQGETCTAYQLDGILSTTSTTTTTTTVSDAKSKGATKTSQSSVVLKPTKPTNSQNAFQLVVDPRLGFLVTPTVSATPTQPQSSSPSIATPNTNSPTIQTRQTRRRGRSSLPPQVTPSPPQPAPKPKTSQNAIQPRPAESTAVGGLSTGDTTVQESNTTISGIVDLTADDGATSIADTREISFNKLQGKTYPSLVVVARPHLSVKDVTGGDRTNLDSKVKTVLMHVPTKFTEWLIQQGLVRSEQACVNHPTTKLKLGMYSDVSKFPYSGGYVWISECCPHRFVSVFSGSLFEGAPHPPSVILKLIYHWACQTNIQNVVQWVKVDNLYVKGMNTWLRASCTVALHSHLTAIGGSGRRVEVGVISLGTTSQDGQQRSVKVEVLGILESEAKRIRLRAVEPMADGHRHYKERFSKILDPLAQWVHPESIIVTDLTVDKGTLLSMGFKHVQQTTASDSVNNHTIMDYLRRIVPRMFQNTLSLLSRQIIQQFLDELVWREWYGTTAAQCFDNILIHISEQTRADAGQALINRLNKVASNPFKNWTINAPTTTPEIKTLENTPNTATRRGRGRRLKNPTPPPETLQPRPPRTLSPDVPEQMVNLENYYYGTIGGKDISIKVAWNVKCSMCKTYFSNNIKLMGHLFSHAHNITGSAQQCRYCLSSVGTFEGLSKHILGSHPSETAFQDGYVCVICETRFPNILGLGKHMSKEHLPSELPYQCGTCGHRCSSHKQAIDHFYKIHDNGSTIQCPFCLKSTYVWSGGRIMPQNLNFFMQHLQKHQKKGFAKKCSKCALWFIHKETLKDHQANMHTSQRRKQGLEAWSTKRNGLMVPKSKQDKMVWEDVDREFNFNNLVIKNASLKHLCKECKIPVTTAKHYQLLESCSSGNCQYTTSCKSAMDSHVKVCKELSENVHPSPLSREMYCVCGYSDNDGNFLAKHLATCERKSAYPSVSAAKAAIKTHSMLDVLGLVRRPEEPPNPPPASAPAVVEVIDLDDEGEAEVVRAKKPRLIRSKKSAKQSILNVAAEKEDDVVILDGNDEKEVEKNNAIVQNGDDSLMETDVPEQVLESDRPKRKVAKGAQSKEKADKGDQSKKKAGKGSDQSKKTLEKGNDQSEVEIDTEVSQLKEKTEEDGNQSIEKATECDGQSKEKVDEGVDHSKENKDVDNDDSKEEVDECDDLSKEKTDEVAAQLKEEAIDEADDRSKEKTSEVDDQSKEEAIDEADDHSKEATSEVDDQSKEEADEGDDNSKEKTGASDDQPKEEADEGDDHSEEKAAEGAPVAEKTLLDEEGSKTDPPEEKLSEDIIKEKELDETAVTADDELPNIVAVEDASPKDNTSQNDVSEKNDVDTSEATIKEIEQNMETDDCSETVDK